METSPGLHTQQAELCCYLVVDEKSDATTLVCGHIICVTTELARKEGRENWQLDELGEMIVHEGQTQQNADFRTCTDSHNTNKMNTPSCIHTNVATHRHRNK